ncbi:ribosome small subunit-dependent GTPase A [Paenibacillus faecalis]|uniref:ribosome small subunit-dependent GTPase A n=1 Tax=Paenibacillus faecalis TaxID=2079532 RepID=UPI001F1F9C0B|nr:ribosome small subunit-dependent GTPase A [Paenibacillus faecalis]
MKYGWNERWQSIMDSMKDHGKPLVPARVTAQYSKQYRIITETGERIAAVTGKYEFEATSRSDFPAVGDWILVELLQGEPRAVIHKLLPRTTAMTRKEAGAVPDEQVIAANTDTVFIVVALNQDFNVRKIERYLIAVWESGSQPVVLLTKADVCDDPEPYVSQVMSSAPGVSVHAVSSVMDQGKEAILPYLIPGHTVAITGSSGAGKSTLLNWLSGEEIQRVQSIREEDARGRHTTTHRELFLLPEGAIMVDTPGMRELQLWESEDGWGEAFSDIEELAQQCRFHDCRHESEAGCAVQLALTEGTLDQGRFANYKKTERELAYLARKENSAAKRQKDRSRARQSKSRRDRRANGYHFSYDGDD